VTEQSDLTDMDFDEISFVPQGANQAAHVVLWKSEDGGPDPRDVTEGYAIATRELARAKVMRKHRGNVVLAERAEVRLQELRQADPMTTYEQAVAVVLNEDPELYVP
jgi:hypothetical protein